MKRCCSGATFVIANVGQWFVHCLDCEAVLAVTDGPRSEVYADL